MVATSNSVGAETGSPADSRARLGQLEALSLGHFGRWRREGGPRRLGRGPAMDSIIREAHQRATDRPAALSPTKRTSLATIYGDLGSGALRDWELQATLGRAADAVLAEGRDAAITQKRVSYASTLEAVKAAVVLQKAVRRACKRLMYARCPIPCAAQPRGRPAATPLRRAPERVVHRVRPPPARCLRP
jgi:hypothetical protein